MSINAQLDHLDATLLRTIQTSFPNPLTDSESASMKAYIVLSHAVLEEHLEALVQNFYDKVCEFCESPSVPLDLVRVAYAAGLRIPEKLRPSYKTATIKGVLQGPGRAHLSQVLRGNNGIRPENVEKLVKSLGVDWAHFDEAHNASLEDLRTLGSKRGEAGHLSPFTSRAVAITSEHYPENAREWVTAARDAVVSIGAYLDGLIGQEYVHVVSDKDSVG